MSMWLIDIINISFPRDLINKFMKTFLTIPNLPPITRIVIVFHCHVLDISNLRSLYFNSFSNLIAALFLSVGTVISTYFSVFDI